MTDSHQTVLIAEDDPVFRRVICFTLERFKLQVEAVADGASAYERLCQGGIDFLVTDQQMPFCTGLELLANKIQNPEIADIPTILCTAKGFELDTQHLKSVYGLVDVMHKPFSPRKLGSVVSECLEQIRLSNHV